MNIRYWLQKTPRPSAILADDKRIEVPNNRRAFKDLEQTIKALDPDKLSALDAKGDVIRSIALESEDNDKPASPEMSDVQLFAKLIAEAYEKGSKTNQPVIDSAMQFVERQGVRLQKAEAELDRLRAHIHKQHLQIAELSGQQQPAGDDSIMSAMLAGALQSGVLQQPPGSGVVSPIKSTTSGAKK